jgi:hypothetical protein
VGHGFESVEATISLVSPSLTSMVKRPSLTPAVVLLAVARLAIWF